jgi:hypothetical protein
MTRTAVNPVLAFRHIYKRRLSDPQRAQNLVQPVYAFQSSQDGKLHRR